MSLTRRLILQKARHPPTPKRRLRRIVSARFQVLFHSPPGVLFTIPSRYYPLSVTEKYSGLPGGPGRFTADSTGPLLLGETVPRKPRRFRLRGSHPLRQTIPGHFT